MRALGIDFGLRRVGLALSDPEMIIASPLKTIEWDDYDSLVREISELIIEKEVGTVVIGKPLHLSGQISEMAEKAQQLGASLLQMNSHVKIIEMDERLSSKEAERALQTAGVKTGHNKAAVDTIAASLILQTYLD
ncbi:MAG TPA: Holliday junction resolvase RuvX [candidate division Zixibacteria bacterium]|nr:Holliday junction resolvase RuvX [candidate division Zixibacteria bacterium]